MPQQNVLFLPPLTAGFQEAVGSSWGLLWEPESKSMVEEKAVWYLGISLPCPPASQVTGSSQVGQIIWP